MALICLNSFSQTVSTKISKAFAAFQSDTQLKNAITSLYIIDAKSGKVIFDRNSKIGLSPASTQKIITAATAYGLLGSDFRYITEFGYLGQLGSGNENGSLYIRGSGDPTLGSWRWPSTSEEEVLKRVLTSIRGLGISEYASFIAEVSGWEGESIPDGWIWQDIGNYYGAGAETLNWRENQYDLVLRSGNTIGDRVSVVETQPEMYSLEFVSYVTSAARGTGDRSYIYLPVNSSVATVQGTIPVDENRFIISGAMPSGKDQFLHTLMDSLSASGIKHKHEPQVLDRFSSLKIDANNRTIFHREQSPLLDSISYWFLKKSINLYGEALVKTFAVKNGKKATTENGISILRDYWKERGIPVTELNMADGSGLSPLNKVTTHAQVAILNYARKQNWFTGYYEGFPEYNGMKMKSGTISDVKGFCGYHRSRNGSEYIFSFLVNNYNGSASALVQKMYSVLNELK